MSAPKIGQQTVSRWMFFYYFFICSQFLITVDSYGQAIKRNRCELKLVADYEFYRLIGNNNYANAARYLVNLIERLNGIFSPVDWGIDINGDRLINLEFSIREIKILDRETSHSKNHFNSPYSAQEDGTFSAIDVLKSFSAIEGTNLTCLTVLISAKIFAAGVLGMSNIGRVDERGICAIKPLNATYMNTAVVTVRRRTGLMITRVVDLVVAHELGHAWGSFHDDPDDPECVPQNSQNGRYLMYESSNTGYERNNYVFSSCSIRSIHKLLYGLAHKCFVVEKGAHCGNGILEPGEECDAGNQINLLTGSSDRCCMKDCKLRPKAVCSPRHSECCTDDCQILRNTPRMCQARSDDDCREASFCNGVDDKCPEPSPAKNGTHCADEGRCQNGNCISYCELLSPHLAPCLCENVTEACLRCCRSTETGICVPIGPTYLPEGSICIKGQCHNNVCEKRLTDSASFFLRFIRNIKQTPHPRFFADYFVFITVLVTLLIWFPCGVFIVRKDNQRHLELIKDASVTNVEYVPTSTRRAVSASNL